MNPSTPAGQMLRTALALSALSLVVLVLAPPANARPDAPPRLSPQARVVQAVGAGELEIVYARPAAREREIWGGLVPWGEVWRTGANEATTFRVSHDVTVEGEALPAGTYAFFTIPNKERWTLIFNSQAEQWGAGGRDPELDVLTVDVRPEIAPRLERFQISVPEVDDAGAATVHLRWQEIAVPFTVAFDVEADVLAAARTLVDMGAEGDAKLRPWLEHMHEHEIALDQALTWARALADRQPGYWTLALQARLLAATGDPKAAASTAERALAKVEAEGEQRRIHRDVEALRGELESWGAAAE